MKLYRITYQIDKWTTQPIKTWALNETDAIAQGIQTLIMAGHTQHEFVEIKRVGWK